jgi:isopentenyldiphosphate isomerase
MIDHHIQLLNEYGEPTAQTRGYKEVHQKGLLHRTVHVWLLNSKGQLLLQKRAKEVALYPGQWDVSVAGHLVSPQSSQEGAQAETKQELTLTLPSSAFQYLFTVREDVTVHNGVHYIENAFSDVYLARSEYDVKKFRIRPYEVDEVRWLDMEEFKKWMVGAGEPLAPRYEEYEKLLEYLSKFSL